ncbi:MAG: GGDEF domain-containing phosphodiesterase [Hydrogenophaga sp.]|nr:GGDEF domain-containing phosphodiesterase [Hydrogenophaga sp.]
MDVSDHIDELTGLMSRVGFYEVLKVVETKPEHVVMAVEISRFGNLNISMGSELGDRVISTVAKRILKVFSHASAIGRSHGNHFVLFFEKLANVQEEVAQLRDFAQRPIIINGEVIVLGVRVGVATGLEINCDDLTKGLLGAAENALHRCKKEGLKVCYYNRNHEVEAKLAHRLENDLRVSLVTNALELHSAITNGEFELVYQPIVGIWGGGVHSFEALLRWNHPLHGEISPSVFIPLAEDISIMDVLGSWVIRKACLDAIEWIANADGKLPSVSINVSPTQFVEPAILINAVRTAIKESAIDPSRIHLEITESAAFSDTMKETLIELRSLGCKIALDDFGTGYSSLTQLHTLPLDYIKIDRSFIQNLCSNNPVNHKRCEKLTQGILALCDILSLTTVVEGVETESQVARLQQLGANLLQGYFYSKPMKSSVVCNFIKQPIKSII